MKDNELDNLFRRNADYLADEPPRDFDKTAFWQQLQTELPKKTNSRKKTTVWWWAAASVLLAGMLGRIWWMQLTKSGGERELAAKVEMKKSPEQTPENLVLETPISIFHEGDRRNQITKKQNPGKKLLPKKEELATHSSLATIEEMAVQTIRIPPAENPRLLKSEPALPEIVAPAIPEKPVYRVVHINEIRERKQQEAKARTRVAVRIGFPSGSRVTTQTNNNPLLNIPIQH